MNWCHPLQQLDLLEVSINGANLCQLFGVDTGDAVRVEVRDSRQAGNGLFKNQTSNERKNRSEEFNRLLDIMDELREKCPWDQKQTNETLRKLTIEETYELADAIMKDD